MGIKQVYNKSKDWTKKNMRKHLVQTTGMLSATNPIWAGINHI